MTRRGWAAIAVGLLGVTVAIIWLRAGPAPTSQQVAGAPPGAVIPGPALTTPPPDELAHDVVPQMDHAKPASGSQRAGPPRAAASSADVELCGIGRVPLRMAPGASAPDALPDHLGPAAADAGRWALHAALDAGDARARAAAILLRGTDAGGGEPSQALQALAEQTSDATVVAWALARCRDDKPCRVRMAQRWQALEPDNVAAWLEGLSGSAEEIAQARHAIASAERFQLHWGALPATMLDHMPANVLPYLHSMLVVEAIGVEAALTLPSMTPLVAICRPRPAPGSQAQGQCDAAARVLAERSDTILGRRIGVRMGELAGWPAAEVAARRALSQNLQLGVSGIDEKHPLSCASAAKTRAWVQAVAKLGEFDAYQSLVAASSPQR